MEGRSTQGPGLATGRLLATCQLSSWPLSGLDRAWLLLIAATGNNYPGFSAVPRRLIMETQTPRLTNLLSVTLTMHVQTPLLRDQEWLLRRRVAWKKGRTGVTLFLPNLSPSRNLGGIRRRQ